MYLSRVPLDITNRNVLRALGSPSVFHGAVENCFSGERKRNLWRLDSLNGQLYILIMSEDMPDLNSFCAQFGNKDKSAETKTYDKFLDSIKNGRTYRFRITVNPTISKCSGGKRGTVCAHITNEYQKKWLLDRAQKNGFIIDCNSFDTVQSDYKRFYKKSSDKKGSTCVTLLSVTYEGVLAVEDAELFRKALVKGIGREKAYGMGLMTVIPLTQ